MKFLALLLSSVLALGKGNFAQQYNGPIHLPIIGENGVPIEPQEVRAARASHFAAHAAARAAAYANPDRSDYDNKNEVDSNNNDNNDNYQPLPQLESLQPIEPLKTSISHPSYQPLVPWPGPYAQVSPDGTPIDTPEVQTAKHQHFHDYWEAARRNAIPQHVFQSLMYGGYPQQPYYGGHPHYRRRRSASLYPHAYQTSQLYPVIGHDGRPLETPEVQEAKARHFEQFQREAVRNAIKNNNHNQYDGYIPYTTAPASYPTHHQQQTFASQPAFDFQQAIAAHPVFNGQAALYSAPEPVTAPHDFGGAFAETAPSPYTNVGYSGSYHYPVIGASGVPTEPPEVQQARAFHLATHAKAKTTNH